MGGNPATPIDILRTLASDEHSNIRDIVGKNLSAGGWSADPAGALSRVSNLPAAGQDATRRFRPPLLELPDL